MYGPPPATPSRTMIALLALPMAVPLGGRGMFYFPKNYHFKIQTARDPHCCLHSPAAMPHLPKKLAPVRAAVASLLLSYHHVGNLYSAGDIANALNTEADVDGNDSINAGVDVTLLL